MARHLPFSPSLKDSTEVCSAIQRITERRSHTMMPGESNPSCYILPVLRDVFEQIGAD